jgi:hypothetical protein
LVEKESIPTNLAAWLVSWHLEVAQSQELPSFYVVNKNCRPIIIRYDKKVRNPQRLEPFKL